MLHHYNEGIAAIQIDRDRVALHTQYGGATLAITTVPHLIDLAVDAEHLIVLSKDGDVQLFHINKGGIELRSQFIVKYAVTVALYRDSIFVAADRGTRLEVLELDGTQRVSLPYPDSTITHLSVNSDFLALATSQRDIHLLDVTTGEPQEVASPIRLEESGGSIVQVGCNADGTWVSLTVDCDKQSSSAMYLCKFSSCDPSGSTDSSERVVKAALPSDLTTSTVRIHCWDPSEANVMACEYSGGATVLFITDQGQIVEADRVSSLAGQLLGMDFPRLYSAEIEYGDRSASSHHNARDAKRCDVVLSTTVLKSFRGMEDEGPSTLSALVQFAYFTALGDLEKACISIQLVKIPEVWERLCKLCIKQKNLSLLERCLPNITNGEKVMKAAVKRAAGAGPVATLAAIALELGATDEAEELLAQCSRYDLLGELLRSQNRWDEALVLDQEHGDDTSLAETHYKYAQYLEKTAGEEDLAIEHYILSGRVKEFLERLVESGRFADAENIVVECKESELLSWLAERYEQNNNVNSAMELYQLSGDDLGLARLALRQNDFDTAIAIAENGDATVVRHIALHLEGVGEAQRAVSLFTRGGMLDDAMRLAKQYGMHSEIVETALDSGDLGQIGKCANWLEDCGQLVRAAQLHAKDGNKSKALELCLRIGDDSDDVVDLELKQVFSSIIGDIDDVTTLNDAEVSTYARRFITWDLGESAFDFLVKSRGQYSTFFSSFASLCSDRGDYRLASKLFAKAGDKVSSLECLVQLKDTTTIIAFAKAARIDEAYEIAARYLQSLPEWTQDEHHVNTILSFLAKARNHSQLIQVHEKLARACIDEGEDYEKALDLLTQGASHVEKIDDIHERATFKRQLQRNLYSVARFVRAKKNLNLTTEPMEQFCAEAARENETNSTCIVRVEHGIKALVLRYVSLHRYQDSYDLIQAMDYPSRYISRDIMEQVWVACDQDPGEVAEIIADDENRNGDDSSMFASNGGKLDDGHDRITDEERTVLSGMGLNF